LVGEKPADAARAKLMLQIMMGSMVGALAEAMHLSGKAGVDPEQARAQPPRERQQLRNWPPGGRAA
jgi:3-hydroxyisobutyrate dehydrogenase-like beta-hydroxyacid dehydrogenase